MGVETRTTTPGATELAVAAGEVTDDQLVLEALEAEISAHMADVAAHAKAGLEDRLAAAREVHGGRGYSVRDVGGTILGLSAGSTSQAANTSYGMPMLMRPFDIRRAGVRSSTIARSTGLPHFFR